MRNISLAGLALTATLACAAPAGAQQIQVVVNGSPVQFNDTQPRMVNGRVLVPLRGVLEKLGAHVGWIQQTQTVVADKGNMDINLPIGSHTAQVNGQPVNLDVPAMVVAGSTLVPLRFVSEALGADVSWSNQTETVAIRLQDGGESDVHYRAHRRFDPGPAPIMKPAPEMHRDRRVIVAGTVIPLQLSVDLSSDNNQTGDPFNAIVENNRYQTGLPDGTRIEGVVREAVAAHNGRPGMIDLEFRKVVFPNGDSAAIDGSAINLDNKGIHAGPDGRLVASRGKNDDQLKWVGIGAGAELVVGTVAHGNQFLDTLLGGGAGYLFGQSQRKSAHNVHLAAGTQMGLRVDQDFKFVRAWR